MLASFSGHYPTTCVQWSHYSHFRAQLIKYPHSSCHLILTREYVLWARMLAIWAYRPSLHGSVDSCLDLGCTLRSTQSVWFFSWVCPEHVLNICPGLTCDMC